MRLCPFERKWPYLDYDYQTQLRQNIPCNYCEFRETDTGDYRYPDDDGCIGISYFFHMMCNKDPHSRKYVYCNSWHTAYDRIPDACYGKYRIIREPLEEIG